MVVVDGRGRVISFCSFSGQGAILSSPPFFAVFGDGVGELVAVVFLLVLLIGAEVVMFLFAFVRFFSFSLCLLAHQIFFQMLHFFYFS